jgi:fused signal recognition particle receptor
MELDLLLYIATGLVGLTGAGYLFFRRPKGQPPTPEIEAQPDEDTAEIKIERGALKTTSDSSQAPTEAKERKELKSLHDALSKTREGFWGKIKNQFSGKPSISSAEIDDIEEALYTSDLGPKTVDRLISSVTESLSQKDMDMAALQNSLRTQIQSIFSDIATEDLKTEPEKKTTVWMVVGVNGAGKTTTIGKLASQQVALGKRVMIAAGDTFRAAADEQLKVWATRAEVEIFSPEGIKDPSAVAFDAVQKAVAKGFDLVIIDTAGRLHTQKNLMEELKKMKRVIAKAHEGAPDETLLVLDANSGQNALMQTEQFHQALEVTGVILTKMDGSAKGGVAVGIACEHQLPIKMIGVGEKIEDLRPFNSSEFVDSIL